MDGRGETKIQVRLTLEPSLLLLDPVANVRAAGTLGLANLGTPVEGMWVCV